MDSKNYLHRSYPESVREMFLELKRETDEMRQTLADRMK